MQPHKNNNDLTTRLTACVERTGGKRAMATAALISEAQLFRYLNGESDIPSDRLLAMAKASQVDPGWLLTGHGDIAGTVDKDTRPSFRSDLMVQVVQLFEELLVEFDKPFSPRQRARAIAFLYMAMRHEETMRGAAFEPKKFDILKCINYLAELRTEEELDILIGAIDLLEYHWNGNDLSPEKRELLRTWCNLIVRGMKGYYSSYSGQVYFERKSGGQLEPTAIMELQNIVMQACKVTGKTELDWLDLGCGNGRHLAHLAKHMPNLHLKGIELSQLGYGMCQDLMNGDKLPKDTVVQGDMRHLPYASDSFDVVFAYMSLHCLPYMPGTGLGMDEVIAETRRVLRPGGIITIAFPLGHQRDYSMPRQFMNEASLRQLAQEHQFQVVDIATKNEQVITNATSNMNFIYEKLVFATLQKG